MGGILKIVDVEVIGEDGKFVIAKLSDGTTAVLETDNVRVQEFKSDSCGRS